LAGRFPLGANGYRARWVVESERPHSLRDAREIGHAATLMYALVHASLAHRSQPRHHRGMLGDAQIRLPQPHAAFIGQTIEPFDLRVQQRGVGQEGDGRRLHSGIGPVGRSDTTLRRLNEDILLQPFSEQIAFHYKLAVPLGEHAGRQ
jgi:hypothetical protein